MVVPGESYGMKKVWRQIAMSKRCGTAGERERETESKSVITLYPSSEEIHNAGKF